ncbi:MAG TPA: hypothetical protein VFL13_11410, partial [Candidatus Baltobacteraceae bacterium]|nr:hypothetical protein [Candidatus Baltobacteraceae bacterium]
MIRVKTAALSAALLFFTVPGAAPMAAGNPLLSPSTLPFGAPPFDKITDADYLPALQTGMQQQLREIDAIAANPAKP